MFIDFITKVSDIIAEPNEDFFQGHFELQNFILAQKMTLITPSTFSDFAFFCTPSTFIPTSTFIREMRVVIEKCSLRQHFYLLTK